MNCKIFSIACIFVATLFTGCDYFRKLESPEEMFRWMNDPSNGLVKSYENNGLEFVVKYLPAEYLTWQQVTDEGFPTDKIDSLLKVNKNNRVFLMTIKPGAKGKGDVMYKELNSVEEFKKRSLAMNFEMSAYVELTAGEEKFKPVLSTLENTYSTVDSRSIFMVFTNDKKENNLLNADELDFTFNDELFGTGINHLTYKKKDIDNIPELAFLK